MLQRLVKYDVAKSDLTEWDSQKLWEKVSTAITNKDQVAATDEKNKLEEAQREAHKARVNRDETYAPRLFNRVLGTDRADGLSDEDYYVYRYFNLVKVWQVHGQQCIRTRMRISL
ncbi:hypothetical protein SARC_14787 [Sphaeroforma arctica JP610]|uniref:Uncharacterized protein n=1 Tax=Sphaeroforma arctica JP610 TaxID=667725 RepID=A0A0L0F7E4_9EUKA|nr:hypothetical protein SARC_14787 [Sphaeroforma arctica JP610]KNC72652.1 hypothetical protein SARC_14787 [Sphaeroforma arctica JP610]|eukprot:XP_014146554.1 hypothetical protein SARC_14787 [Sphaeroforma arctica JP610]